MKKFFSFIVAFTIVLSLIGANFLSYPQKVNAAPHGCTKDTVFDPMSGIRCSLIASCPPGETVDFRTGNRCPGVTVNTTVNTNDLTIAKTLGVVKIREKNGRVVQAIQEALNSLGFDLGVDGKFGPQTQIAIKTIQRRLGVTADGVIGPKTFEALQKELNKKPNPVALLKKVQIAKNLDPVAGGGTSPNQQNLDDVTCGPPTDGTGSQIYNATITNDNFFLAYAWHKENKTLRYLGDHKGNVSTYVLDDTEMIWRTPLNVSFTLNPGEKLAILAVNDTRIIDGLLGSFTFTDTAGATKTSLTNGALFQRMKTSIMKPDRLNAYAVSNYADLIKELEEGTWESVPEMGQNGMGPWDLFSEIAKAASWLKEWGKDEGENHMTFFVTKGSGNGSLPPCDTCPPGTTGTYPTCSPVTTCPPGTTGTPPNCVCPPGSTGVPPNCVNTTCPPGTTGTPPSCVSPIDVSATKTCRGIHPALTLDIKIKMSAPVVVNGIPQLQIQPNGVKLNYLNSSTDGTELYFRYFAPSPDTDNYTYDQYIGPVKFIQPFQAGVSIKNAAGNNVDVTGQLTMPDAPNCPSPIITTTIMTSRCMTQVLDIEHDNTINSSWGLYGVSYSEPITVTGNPKIEFVNSLGNTISAILQPLTSNKSLFFKTADLEKPKSYYFGDNLTINLNGGSIKNSAMQTVPLVLGNINATTAECVIQLENPMNIRQTVSSMSGSCSGQEKLIQVTFKTKVNVVNDNFGLKVKDAPGYNGVSGVVYKYVNGSGSETLTFKYTSSTPDTNPAINYHGDDNKLGFWDISASKWINANDLYLKVLKNETPARIFGIWSIPSTLLACLPN